MCPTALSTAGRCPTVGGPGGGLVFPPLDPASVSLPGRHAGLEGCSHFGVSFSCSLPLNPSAPSPHHPLAPVCHPPLFPAHPARIPLFGQWQVLRARKQTGASVDGWDMPTCSLQPFAISMETMGDGQRGSFGRRVGHAHLLTPALCLSVETVGDGQWLKSHVKVSWDCYDKLLLIQTSCIEERKCLLPHSGGQTSET